MTTPLLTALALLVGAATATAAPRDVVATVAGLPVTEARVEAQPTSDPAQALQDARDEALLHRAALDAGAGLDPRYHDLVAPAVQAGGRSLARRASRSSGIVVDRAWLRSVDGTRRDLPPGTRRAPLEPGVAMKIGDHRLPLSDASTLEAGQSWLATHHQAAAARMLLAAGAPEAREAVVTDWLEQQFGALIETEDLVPSRMRQWYDAHRSEFPEERLWVRLLHSRDTGEQQRAQLHVFHHHIGMDPSRFSIYARMMHRDDPDAGAVIGPIRPGDPGPLPPALADRILSSGESGLLPTLTLEDHIWVVLVEKREGGFPEVEERVAARVRDEALEQRTADLLATLRSQSLAAPGRGTN
jgi:hypothetical protein